MQGCGGPCGYKYMDSYWADQGGWSWSRNLLQRGYLTATTDMGHLLSDQGGTAGFLFAYKNRTAEINFAYKATHQLVEAYKAMALEYYGTAHRMSLYRGSSTGGRQGLVSMQRYPLDFNGVVVGHPASNETAIGSIQETWLGLANKDPETGKQVLHVSDLTPLNQVALASCDHLDGLVDGLIDNADRCVIDWGLIDCQSPRKIINDTACFSAQKIKHAKLLYSNPVDSNGTELIHSSNLPGNELSWGLYEFYVTNDGVDHDNACYNGSISFNIGAAFENDFLPLDWKPEEYDWDNYPPKLRYMEQLYTGTNADLKAFKEAGGKFLMTQGWADYNVTPREF
jgi:feruloyl esterase